MHASSAQAFQDRVTTPNAGIKLEAGASDLNSQQVDSLKSALGTVSQYKEQLVLKAASKILSPTQVKIPCVIYPSQAEHAAAFK